MSLTTEDLAAIRGQIDAALDARGVTASKALIVSAADSNIIYAEGGVIATEASEALLPGVRFATALAKDRFGEIGQAVIRLNCGLGEDFKPDAAFGQLFAQSDSVQTNPLQNLTSPIVFDVKWSGVTHNYVLDRSRTMRLSDDKFPDAYACRFVSWAQLTEWCRLTREDWLSRGWKPGA